MILLLIYVIGFVISLTILKFFGEKMGMNYDSKPFDGSYYDDWEDNASAFTSFSLLWPITLPLGLLIGGFSLLYKISKWYVDFGKKKKCPYKFDGVCALKKDCDKPKCEQNDK